MVTKKQIAKNALTAFLKAGKELATKGRILAPETTRIERYETCLACEHMEMGQCRKCGCYIRFKTQVTTESCPLDPPKWDKV